MDRIQEVAGSSPASSMETAANRRFYGSAAPGGIQALRRGDALKCAQMTGRDGMMKRSQMPNELQYVGGVLGRWQWPTPSYHLATRWEARARAELAARRSCKRKRSNETE